jgi:processing peptidase subunit alpha
MSADIDSFGGQIYASSSRESMIYQSSQFHAATPTALSVMADSILNPLFLQEELETQREAARYEVRELSTRPDSILPEIMHYVAYGGKTLGNPSLCAEEQIDRINADMLRAWTKEWFRPERMVVAGAGISHEGLLELATKHFASLQSPPPPVYSPSQALKHSIVPPPPAMAKSTKPSLYKSLTTAASSLFSFPSPTEPVPINAMANEKANYTGGQLYVPDKDQEFDHIYIAFEGVRLTHPDVYASAVLQTLLGGGGSFSSGGPGKGLYTRLYTQVLNHYYTVEHCASFHHLYTDSSLLGLYASFSKTESIRKILAILAHQLSLLLYDLVNPVELNRAKKQLQSSVAMAMESRVVEVEDVGRQVLMQGHKVEESEMRRRIEEVTSEDIMRVAKDAFGPDSKPPTIIGLGTQDITDWKAVFQTYGVGQRA